MQKPPFQIVILAGGVGKRLWPMSREAFPKQFQPLVGKQTLFELALSRAKKITSPKNIFIATNAKFSQIVKKQAKGIPSHNIILESAFRDTATCLGFASTILESRNSGGVMGILYADNLIRNEKEFVKKMKVAYEIACEGKISIVEVESEFPSTQYGWVEVGKELKKIRNEKVFELKRFVEKPNLAKAKKFHSSKKFFWNTGLYVWKTDVILSKFQAHLPQTYKHLHKISQNLKSPNIIRKEYSACEKISIDFGVMEKNNPKEVAIIPSKLGWSDVGSWESLKNELSSEKENLSDGDLISLNSKGNFIKTSSSKLVALAGVENLIVVETDDALLICKKEMSGEVKKIVQILEKGVEKRKKLL